LGDPLAVRHRLDHRAGPGPTMATETPAPTSDFLSTPGTSWLSVTNRSREPIATGCAPASVQLQAPSHCFAQSQTREQMSGSTVVRPRIWCAASRFPSRMAAMKPGMSLWAGHLLTRTRPQAPGFSPGVEGARPLDTPVIHRCSTIRTMAKPLYRSSKNVVYSAKYHLVWCPKYRRRVLVGAVANRTAEIIHDVCDTHDAHVLGF